MKRFSLASILAISIFAAPAFAESNAVPYAPKTIFLKDVSPSHWAYDNVKEVVEDYQIMKGDGRGNFAGYKTLTRYELAATISSLIKFYNQEFSADREDLTSLANIMEQFQEEMKIMEARMLNLQRKIGSVERAIATDVSDLKDDVALNTSDIEVMKESGFVLDKLIKGTGRDIKHVAYGFSHQTPKERRLAKEAQAQTQNGDGLSLSGATGTVINTDLDVAGQLIESKQDVLPQDNSSEYLIEE